MEGCRNFIENATNMPQMSQEINMFRTQEQRTGYHHQRNWWQEDGLSMCSTSPTTWTSRPLPSTPLSFKVIIIIFYIGMNLFSHLKVICARNSDIYDQVNWRWKCIEIVPPNPRGDENTKKYCSTSFHYLGPG